MRWKFSSWDANLYDLFQELSVVFKDGALETNQGFGH
jgi:hypothetical protein